MNPDQFRRFGHKLMDWIADYREQIESRPVVSNVKPGSVHSFPLPRPYKA
jgi:aromatic-L-amino-acid/L-tryptophan decarboxylase